MEAATLQELLAVTAALSDENRVRVVAALQTGELCVCQIVELLDLAPSTVSKHLAILKQSGLIDSRKDGRWIYYRLAGHAAPRAARTAIRWLRAALNDDRRVAADGRRLRTILRIAPETLCCRQRAAGDDRANVQTPDRTGACC